MKREAEPIKMSELMNFSDRQLLADEAVDRYKYVLYGGAVGGGKSYFIRRKLLKMLLQWYKELGMRGIEVGLFCEDYPTLKDRQLSKIIKEFPEWLGTLHDDHKAHGKCFILAPEYGGGIIKFRNLDDPSKYQSSEFAAIAVDEVTKNEKATFLDLKHRLRWPGIEDTRFFAGTNPGGPGHAWVKKLWLDRDYEPEELSEAEMYYFVPAKAEDNPYLPESYLRQLDTLPDDMRKALRDGDWDIFKGQYFYEWRRDLHVIEPFAIPEDWFRYVCGDYGFTAPAAVYWCAVSPEDVVYVYRELYVTGKTYADLARTIVTNTPENEAIDYWVFDPAIWSKDGKSSVGLSGAEIMEQTYTQVMKGSRSKKAYLRLLRGNNDRLTGWGHLRERLKPQLRPDGSVGARIQFFNTCTNAIRSIPSLVFDKNKVEDCDCFVRGTPVLTEKGYVPVETVEVGDMMVTPIGLRPVIKAGISGHSDAVVTVRTEDGRELRGTANHHVYVRNKGLVPLEGLCSDDILMERINISLVWRIKQWNIRVLSILGELVGGITSRTERIFPRTTRHYTDRCIWTPLARFQMGFKYIIKTITSMIIGRKILLQYQETSTCDIITKQMSCSNRMLQNGGTQLREKSSCEGTQKRCEETLRSEGVRADIVAILLKLDWYNRFFVRIADTLRGIIPKGVRCVVMRFFKKRMGNVPQKPARISAVGNYGKERVYRLTVADAHLYYANGFLVTNTKGEDHAADSIRYGLMSEPRRTRTPEELAESAFKRKMKENRKKKRLSVLTRW